MHKPKHIVLIAGEESGDKHAAKLAESILQKNPSWILTGVGGKHLREAGVKLVSNLAEYGATGLTEVVKHGLIIYRAFQAIKTHLKTFNPDLVIFIDCPSFNLRVAKYAKFTLGLNTLYYISPQIWAWKAKRIHLIKKCIDRMAVILPFEKKIYEDAKVPVSFVGHPLLERIPNFNDLLKLREHFNLPKNKKIVAILPGSRRNEIENHLPILAEAANVLSKTKDIHFVIPVAHTLAVDKIKSYFSNYPAISIDFIQGHALELIGTSDCVIVASGTASLECALMVKPMCIIYKASLLTYLVASKLIKINYLGLCNLLQNKMIVPEHLQYDFSVPELIKTVQELLENETTVKQMQKRLQALKESLSAEKADCTIEDLVYQALRQ